MTAKMGTTYWMVRIINDSIKRTTHFRLKDHTIFDSIDGEDIITKKLLGFAIYDGTMWNFYCSCGSRIQVVVKQLPMEADYPGAPYIIRDMFELYLCDNYTDGFTLNLDGHNGLNTLPDIPTKHLVLANSLRHYRDGVVFVENYAPTKLELLCIKVLRKHEEWRTTSINKNLELLRLGNLHNLVFQY